MLTRRVQGYNTIKTLYQAGKKGSHHNKEILEILTKTPLHQNASQQALQLEQGEALLLDRLLVLNLL